MTDTQVRAGWYPDPLGMPQLRWWDGRSWTSHTSTARHAPVRQAAPAEFAEPDESRPRARHRAADPAGDDEHAAPPVQLANGQSALPAGTGAVPELGWAGAALTLHSVQSTRVPMLIELGVAGHPTIRIDPRSQAYDWLLELDRFPESPTGVVVSVELVGDSTPSPFELPGKSLDELLWKVGRAAFPERLAPWLEEGDGYWLTRWPNWTTLQPETDHIRQTAMLANTLLTVAQLAALSGRGVDTTRTLVNALSLMGVLGVAPAATLVPRAATPEALGENSLFQRLRRRFRMI
ncbi:DUF2510 domain-containing protein [Protaetiibacter mangrovi]|uniref:DUF2510 domain-containing protein n=1 Tax=Protaetiibacter mangrovi TaxID=2970926 RepID=A0ABT1ZEG0_9MICO|nr:DUF2510 domain-containing protein [Protaetiibacter mangrovi]MCS0499095.1 DUF2510 domain-containing protein [Protaetiibacter mangrovi]